MRGDLLAYEQRVLDPAPGLLPAVPGEAGCAHAEGRSRPKERRLPYLPVLHPEVALEGGQGAHAQDGHRHTVHLQGLGLEGVGGLPRLHAGPLVGLFEMGLRPVGAQGAQHQAGHHPLPLVEGRQRAHQGDEGVGAGVQQVVVPEGAQGDVLWGVRPERDGPRLLPVVEPERVVLRVNPLDAGLGVVGRDLAPHHRIVQAAGHQGHAVHVPGKLQGEGLRHGDGLEQVSPRPAGCAPPSLAASQPAARGLSFPRRLQTAGSSGSASLVLLLSLMASIDGSSGVRAATR